MKVVLAFFLRKFDPFQPLDGSATNLTRNDKAKRETVVRLKTKT